MRTWTDISSRNVGIGGGWEELHLLAFKVGKSSFETPRRFNFESSGQILPSPPSLSLSPNPNTPSGLYTLCLSPARMPNNKRLTKKSMQGAMENIHPSSRRCKFLSSKA